MPNSFERPCFSNTSRYSWGGFNTHRFSFIVKENDNKVDGQQEYGMRIFDKRLSRFKSVNPKMDSFKGGSDVTMEVDIGKENK